MDEERAGVGARSSDGSGGFGIDAERGIGVRFGLVDGGVGRGIDHHIGPDIANHRGERRGRIEIGGNVGARTIAGRNHQLAQRRQTPPQFAANLAIAAKQQEFHGAG